MLSCYEENNAMVPEGKSDYKSIGIITIGLSTDSASSEVLDYVDYVIFLQ